MKEQIAWPSLAANNRTPSQRPLTRKTKPRSATVTDPNGEGPLETTAPLQTQSTVTDPNGEGPLETTTLYTPRQQSQIPMEMGHWRLQPLYMYTDPVNSHRSQWRRATGDYNPLHVYRPSQQSQIPVGKGH